MKNIVEQLSTYKSVHLNKSNIKTHFIGIPLIIWSVALLVSSFSFTLAINDLSIPINAAAVLGGIVLLYYILLSRPLALMSIILFGPLMYSAIATASIDGHYWIALGVFTVGWVFQFIGHAYEKAKPAFVDDLNQLFIGPLFLLAEIYFALGMNKELEAEVKEEAIIKRKAFEAKMTS